MLGPPKPRRLGQAIAVSLDQLVPADHFYRHLEAKLDLGFVRDWARELYADRGRPSIDPVVIFKPQLVMFFEGSAPSASSSRRPRSTLPTAGIWATPSTSRCPTTGPGGPVNSAERRHLGDALYSGWADAPAGPIPVVSSSSVLIAGRVCGAEARQQDLTDASPRAMLRRTPATAPD